MPDPATDFLNPIIQAVQNQLSTLQEQLPAKTEEIRSQARSQLTEKLNNAVRRLRQAESRDVWFRTLVEATSEFAERTAAFSVSTRLLRHEGEPAAEAPLALAPAFASAVESKDVVVAAATPRELSPAVFELLDLQAGAKVWLFPLVVRNKVEGVLCARSAADVSAIELLCSLAAVSVEATEEVKNPPAGLIHIAGAVAAPPPPSPAARPDWTDLSRGDQQVHLKAQRFARNTVAEFLLNRAEQVRRGRASNDLYSTLREEIDAARENFRTQFVHACPSMVDYLHLELVRTLAKNDSRALGADYPGPLP